MDYADMERKIRENGVKLVIFCSPHNPCGRVWTRDEIERAMAVYRDCGCTVISDEIWADLTFAGHPHLPTQSVSEDAKQRTIAFYAPSKTFNLAGLIGSYHIIYNDELREKVGKIASKCHYNNMNVLSMYALTGAYTEQGMEWVDDLREVIGKNIDYACGYIESELSGLKVSKPEGTYMLFIDCSEYCSRSGKTMDELLKAGWDTGVAWQDGRPFKEGCYIRMNLALPESRVREAFDRLGKYVI
jgi:cystathionine beta-lyase